MSEPYAHVTNFVLEHPWAVSRPMMSLIAGVLARRIAGLGPDPAALEAAANKRRETLPQARRGGTVAVVPVHGVIMPRADMMTEVSGLVSLEAVAAQVRDAAADSSIKTILLDIDSPGGSVSGCTECVDAILAARELKPVIAASHYTMASAAYWIGAAATEIVASPSSQVGSIGVYTMHNDISEALKQLGINRTYISAGKDKLIGKETEPLSERDASMLQKTVDEAYARFTADVGRGRKVPASKVREGYGQGRTVGAEEALSLGMVDRLESFDETMARLAPSAVLAAHAGAPAVVASVPDHSWRLSTERALFDLELATLGDTRS